MHDTDTTSRILGGLLFCSAVLNACLLMSNGGYVRENRELKAENVAVQQDLHRLWRELQAEKEEVASLQNKLDWWECTQQPAPLPEPVEIDPPIPAEVVPESELAEAVTDELPPGVVGAAPPRSGKWPTVSKHHIAAHPDSAWKGSKYPRFNRNSHHIIPFSWANKVGHPWLELCEENLITLAGAEHLQYGHGGDFHHFNIDIRHDAEVGEFNSRGISTWAGNEEMEAFLQWALGPPSKERPKELPEIVTGDALKVWKAWLKQKPTFLMERRKAASSSSKTGVAP